MWLRHLWRRNFRRSESRIGITRALRRELDKLPPGNFLTIRAEDGVEFTIINTDDLMHIIELANLKSNAVSERVI